MGVWHGLWSAGEVVCVGDWSSEGLCDVRVTCHPLPGDKVKDSWRGAATWSQGSNKQYFISKADYNEKGHEYLKPFFASNTSPPSHSK